MSWGSKQKQTTTSEQRQDNRSTSTVDPIIQQQVYDNIRRANEVADGWTPATIGGPAGFTPDQLAAFQAARGVGSAGSASTTAAMEAAMKAAGYTPDQIKAATYEAAMVDKAGTTYDANQWSGPTSYEAQGYKSVNATSEGYDAAKAEGAEGYTAREAEAAALNRGQVRDLRAGNTLEQLPGYLQNFDHAYQSDVIDSAINDLDRARVRTIQGDDATAARAGAWGSRRDLMTAETNRGFADAVARTSADLRNKGFQTALSTLSADQQRQLAAELANQEADVSVHGSNASLRQSTNLSNAEMANLAARHRADAVNSFTLTNAEAENEARRFGADAANTTSLANAENATLANKDNAAATNEARRVGVQLGADVGLANSRSVNDARANNATNRVTLATGDQRATNDARSFNADSANRVGTANQNANVTANGQRITAAGTLADVGRQQQDMAVAGATALNKIGTQQQDYDQSVIDVNNANAQNAANAEVHRLGIRQSGLNGAVYGTTTTGSGTSSGTGTTTTTTSPGLGQIIGTGLQVAGPIIGAIKSDKRLKHNIKTIGDPLAKVRKLRGVNYNWNGGGKDAGLLAQDVERALPAAKRDMGGGVKGYDPAPVLGLMAEAIKALERKVAA